MIQVSQFVSYSQLCHYTKSLIQWVSDKVTYLAVQDSYKDKQEDFALAVQYA